MTSINQQKQVVITVDEAVEALYRGGHIDHNWIIDNPAEYAKYTESSNFFSPDYANEIDLVLVDQIELTDDFHSLRQKTYFVDPSYLSIDVKKYVLDLCKRQDEIDRINEELALFERKELLPLLQLMIYLVDKMREKNVVWGVGRGSSVSSYCLYLIGIHKIDSIKYGLDIKEFLK